MPAPWDVYIDEYQVQNDWALGFLAVPNSPSFTHKLYRCRHVQRNGSATVQHGEIHWNRPRLDLLDVEEDWIFRVHQHKGARFYRMSWKKGETKELTITRFLATFCRIKRLDPPYDVVVFLDFNDDHASADIQNAIRITANIARCYHLDSKNNDCLQCCDLLLGARSMLWNDPTVRFDYPTLLDRRKARARLSDSEVKRYLAGHLASFIDSGSKSFYDSRRSKS